MVAREIGLQMRVTWSSSIIHHKPEFSQHSCRSKYKE